MVVINKTNLEKLDLLMGFVNRIVHKVSSTEEVEGLLEQRLTVDSTKEWEALNDRK